LIVAIENMCSEASQLKASAQRKPETEKSPLVDYIYKLPPGLANTHITVDTDPVSTRTFSKFNAAALLPWGTMIAERLASGRLPFVVIVQRTFTDKIDRTSKLPVKKIAIYVFERSKVRKMTTEQARTYLEIDARAEHAENPGLVAGPRTDIVYA
jgi:hypothetical protein